MTTDSTTAASDLSVRDTASVGAFVRSGQPYVWTTAGAIAVSIIITVALLVLTMVKGMAHFWPADLVQATYREPGSEAQRVLAELRSREEVSAARLKSAGLPVDEARDLYERILLKIGNRDLLGVDFRYVVSDWLVERSEPVDAAVWERLEWGNLHGFLQSATRDGLSVSGDAAWDAYRHAQRRANGLRERIAHIEKGEIGRINYSLEQLRLEERRRELAGVLRAEQPAAFEDLDRRRAVLDTEYAELAERRSALYADLARDRIVVRTVTGEDVTVPLDKLVDGYRPNRMNLPQKLWHWTGKLWEFVSEEPREANTEGGIFPAIFGTVMMVLLMSVFVTPFGILAALYLREYAKQGAVTRTIRIAVNNLAGVPSIVYGMFGLGFFVYFLGGNLDRLFYPEASPAPVFGTPGILWASLTLALLTLPVVIVATEEGLARIPRSLREASLALGATKAETLWRVVMPMASPAMMTGLILAIARAAGEVAPLMLVGVVKLAPSLPLDGNFPFLHLDRKFMHLGFHIYDVGFQSPNVEAARPLVYATSFLLVVVIVLLNVFAIGIRNRLRERYKALDH
ncbi:phosphate ABC transporter permease PstA [Panacagrimonas sp.]|uniref:phosphate ABC transporter permease PstA n=1 Tax=Panacagrimonas sp. TaxID=2480088 RepID=UPI003B51F5F3